MKSYFTVHEAALKLGVSAVRIRAMIHSGKIKAERFGWALSIPAEELNNWQKVPHKSKMFLEKKPDTPQK